MIFIKRILFIVGLGLLIINLIGLFIPLRNSAIYTEENTYFQDDIVLNEEELYKELERKDESDEAYVIKANKAIHDGIAHYWKEEGINKYNIRVPLYENYLLFLAGHIAPKKFKRYEFNDYKKAIKRGVGLCSQHTMILSDVLEKNNIETKIINLPCHVVLTAQVDKENDLWWIVDPDFGIIIKQNIEKVSESLDIVNTHYSNAGYSSEIVNNVSNCYKDVMRIFENSKDYSGWKRYYIEKAAYIAKWLIPLALIMLYIYKPKRNL